MINNTQSKGSAIKGIIGTKLGMTQVFDANNKVVPVTTVSMLYDTLKAMHKTMGEAIEQHDAKLHLLQRNKDNMN